jgi:DNA-binding transcriptional regulator YiaG
MGANGDGDVGSLDLRSMRAALGLSRQRLAELLDGSLSAVALDERGYRSSSSAVFHGSSTP